MLIQLAMNIAGINLVALLNQVSVWWHIVIVAAVVILVFLAGKPDQSGLTLFAVQPQDVAGSWQNNLAVAKFDYGAAITYPVILAFFFSLLQANWTYTGYDASAHVAEETVGARVSSAWGIFLSVAVSAVVGFVFLFALTTHLPSLSTLFRVDGRRPARRRDRDRYGLLRPFIGRIRGPHVVRVQSRRWVARLGLAQASLAPLPDSSEQSRGDRRRVVALHHRGVRRRCERRPWRWWNRDHHHHRDQHDLPLRGVRCRDLPRRDD
jgi:hypothetical protein